ncbi:hypothetical protein D3C84_968650 [compost metagenome]
MSRPFPKYQKGFEMNVAFYDLVTSQLHEHTVRPGATPDDIRHLVLMVQMEALQNGDSMQGLFLVAWDQAQSYHSVFVLDEADYSILETPLLDSIKAQAEAIGQ